MLYLKLKSEKGGAIQRRILGAINKTEGAILQKKARRLNSNG